MSDYSKDFGPFKGRVWMNAASIGPLPRSAVKAAREVIRKLQNPTTIPEDLFFKTPKRMKAALSRLINVPAKSIILGNSASYGLHLWANGVRLQAKDEVLLVKGDFPASIYPWLYLRDKGIIVREIIPKGQVLHADDVEANITDATKILCATWVDSFTGCRLNIKAIGEICRKNNVWFLLNVTQGLGAEPLNLSELPIDGITCTGYKWLCGPYGTGFCWMRPELVEILDYNQAYWIVMQGQRKLDQIRDYKVRTDLGSEKYDVFGTANLSNFIPWKESINYLVEQGLENIQKHNKGLVDRFISKLDQEKFQILSPKSYAERTAIIIVSHKTAEQNKSIFNILQNEKIIISYREGNLRFAPHLYNTKEEIDRTLKILNAIAD